MVEAMKKLQDHEKFEQISIPALPASMASIPVGQTYELESRKRVEEGIMTVLREKNVSMMGICGMGGVGKTTMAKKIMSIAREEGLFDEIVMVVVSQPIDMFRVQKDMAELLGLKLEVENVIARAHLLRTRLMNTKSILIILDDLWKGLNLEDLGIPHQGDLKECMVLLTSRNTDVFSSMNVEKIFQIKILSEIEAWSLFKERVGACADDQSLIPTAQEIVRECNGLPIALVTVGMALKDKKDKSIWEDAMHELRSCNPRDIPDFLAQVYNPLKLSYDLLESEHARLIFLLCCLFPEDRNIFIFNLSLYAWGLDMFEGIRSLQVARNKVQTLVQMLKSRSLLLDGLDERYVMMHDIVRDVGIYIAAKEGLMDPNLSWRSWQREESNYSIDCTWISLFDADKIKFPGGSDFPNLRFLLIEGQGLVNGQRKELPLCDNFFESARKLYVLSIRSYILISLPSTTQLLKNLRTLLLHSCESLKDISLVGDLVCLEILRCVSCRSIEELPVEIGRLNQLKLLYISYCLNLRTIAAGVISRLIRLEELTVIDSFSKWEWGASEGKNAGLCELNCLSSLTTLRIHIQDASLAAEHIHLSPKLVEFDVQIGRSWKRSRSYGKEMKLELEGDVIIGDWIHQLLRTTEELILRGAGSSKLVSLLPELQSLQLLMFQNAKMTRLIDGRSSGTTTVFPLLEYLNLNDIDELEEIYSGPISSDSFGNLKRLVLGKLPKLQHLWDVVPNFYNLSFIYIDECCSLRSVFPWAMGTDYLLRLENLTIMSCPMLEQVVLWNEEENRQSTRNYRRITFPKLECLQLNGLPRLTTFCQGIDSIEFPALTRMKIVKCPNLRSLVSSTENDPKRCWDDDSLHLFCKPDQAAFVRLEYLKIDGCDSISSLWCDQIPIDLFTRLVCLVVSNCSNIKSLFSLSIARNLVNLKKLSIKSCREMVKVIEEKVDEVERSPFIKLEVLKLIQLPKLKAFGALELPSLIHVLISECPLMERFPFGISTSQISSNSFKNLKSIVIQSCSMLGQGMVWNEEENGMDINAQNCRNHCRITFPKLEKLILVDLPRLTSFCKGIQKIEFPLLSWMEILKCQNLKSLLSSTENDHNKCSEVINNDADDSLHLFCKSEVAFDRLEILKVESISSEISRLCCDQIPRDFFSGLISLTVHNCGNVKSLFSPSIAGNLVNLRELSIESCREMIKVIEGEEVERFPFIKLEVLKLVKLPKLKAFCDWRYALELPSLQEVFISKCPLMERFSFVSPAALNLRKISMNNEVISNTKDLNDALLWGDFFHLEILFGTD